MAKRQGFTQEVRGFDPDPIWVHESAPVWIVHYAATNVRREFWQAYRAVAHLPRGRRPWAVDNRRLNADGYPSLKSAMQAASEFINQKAAA